MSYEQRLQAAESLAAEAKKLFEKAETLEASNAGLFVVRKAYAAAAAADAEAASAYRQLLIDINEEYGCVHCGVETGVLDTDGLCTSCAKEQEEFDNGECPRCGTPSPGSRECYDC